MLEERRVLTAVLWDGGGSDNNWSTPANWVGDVAPVAGDGLVFPVDAAQKININDYPSNTQFKSIYLDGGNYALSGNGVTLIEGIAVSGLSTSVALTQITLVAALEISVDSGSLNVASNIDTNGFGLTVAGSANTTIQGSISGSGGVTKSGTGVLTLAGVNTYTGTTTLANEPLGGNRIRVTNPAGLGSTAGGTVLNEGTTLELDGAAVGTEALTFNGGGVLQGTGISSLAGNIVLVGPDTRSLVGTGTLTLSGAISGPSPLVKLGTGKIILSGANTYTGATTVQTGTLNVRHGFALGSTVGATSVASGATLEAEAAFVSEEPLSLAGSGVDGLGALRSVNGDFATTFLGGAVLASDSSIGVSHQFSTLSLRGVISGAGLRKIGSGTLLLNGNSTYAGATLVDDGELIIQHSSALGAATSGTTVASGATLRLEFGVTVVNESLILQGTGAFGGTHGALFNTVGNNTWSGPISLAGNTTILVSSSTSLALTDGIDLAAHALTLNAQNQAQVSIPATIIGAGGLTKVGAGTLTLSGANSYTGATTVQVGLLKVQNSSALGSSLAGTSVLNGAELQLEGGITVAEPLNLRGTGANGDGALRNMAGFNTWNGPITLGSASKIGIANQSLVVGGTVNNAGFLLTVDQNSASGHSADIAGVISGAGGLTKIGSGQLLVYGANTYSGQTTINAGSINLLGSGTLGDLTSGTVVNSGASLAVFTTSPLTEALTIAGTGAFGGALMGTNGAIIAGAITLADHATIAINNSNSIVTISGAIGDGGSGYGITVNGFGEVGRTLVLSGANTYGGPTAINSGTFRLPTSGRFGNPNLVSLASAAELHFEATAADDAFTTLPGATASVVEVVLNGESRGTITALGPVRLRGLAGNDTFDINASGGWGLLVEGQDDSDTYVVALGSPGGPVFVDDSGTSGTDTLTVNGTSGQDTLLISGSQVTLAGAPPKSVTRGGIENLTVNGVAGGDQLLVNGAVTMQGNLTLRADGAFSSITVSAPINVGAGNVELRATNGITLSGASADISTSGALTVNADGDFDGVGLYSQNDAGSSVFTGPVTITAADVDLLGTLSSNNGSLGSLTLEASTANRTIGIGSGATGNFNLSTAELINLTAGNMVSVGRFGGTGAVDIRDANLTSAGYALAVRGGTTTFNGQLSSASSVHLFSTGAVVDNHPGTDISATLLSLSTVTGVGLPSDPLETSVTRVAAHNTTSGGVAVENFGSLSIGTIFGISGVQAPAGAVGLYTHGDLTIENTSAANDVNSGLGVLMQVFGSDKKLTLASGANVQSLTGAHDYTADKMDLAGTITAGTQRVGLFTSSNNKTVNLGSTSDTLANTLELSDAELDRVTTGLLQLGGFGATSAITISSAIDPANTSTLQLISGGSVTQSAQLTVANLAVTAGTGITLDNGNNRVGTVALTSAAGNIAFDENDGYTVGSVSNLNGVSAANGAVGLYSHGNVTIDNTTAANDVNSALGIVMQVFGNDKKLTIASGASVRTTAGAQAYVADKMDLAGTIMAGTQAVLLRPSSANKTLILGSASDTGANVLELSDAELDRITAGVIRVGTYGVASGIVVTSGINPANTSTLRLFTDGFVHDGTMGYIQVPRLAITAVGFVAIDNVGVAPGGKGSTVQILAGRVYGYGAPFIFHNYGPLSIGGVDDTIDFIRGIVTNGGRIEVRANSPLTIDEPVINEADGDVVLVASNDGGDDDNLTINASVQSIGGSVELTAGTDLVIQQGGSEPVVISAGGTIEATVEGSTQIGGEIQIVSPGAPVFNTSSMAVFGTPNSDHIEFRAGSNAGDVEAFVNGTSRGIVRSASQLTAYGLAGDDDIEVSGSIQASAWLYGGEGHDRIKGGAGNDVLLGGDGDDLLVGGQGRDILIGQLGADRLVGNADDDILIAGTTAFDDNNAALSAIFDEWTSARSYADRTANIAGTGSGAAFAARLNDHYFLNSEPASGPVTVYDDDAKDTLTGSAGQDWFFANLFLDNGDDAEQKDKITDLHASEFALDLDFIGVE